MTALAAIQRCFTSHIMVLFHNFEKRFHNARHPFWRRHHKLADLQPQMRRRRPGLVIEAMADEDDPAPKILAERLEGGNA